MQTISASELTFSKSYCNIFEKLYKSLLGECVPLEITIGRVISDSYFKHDDDISLIDIK
jgi:hypothetical protein